PVGQRQGSQRWQQLPTGDWLSGARVRGLEGRVPQPDDPPTALGATRDHFLVDGEPAEQLAGAAAEQLGGAAEQAAAGAAAPVFLRFHGALAMSKPMPHQSVMPAKMSPAPTKADRPNNAGCNKNPSTTQVRTRVPAATRTCRSSDMTALP